MINIASQSRLLRNTRRFISSQLQSFSALVLLSGTIGATFTVADELAPMPKLKLPAKERIELGKQLFFDKRLSGDATISCATCHDPQHAFTDGLALSRGYPGTLYFRNTPTIINAASHKYFYWDGRMSGDDLPSLIRDHISEAHFMQADGRLVVERMRQVPAYEKAFDSVFGGEPSYGRILNAVAAFAASIRSKNAPIDKFLNGDESAISVAAKNGLSLFTGKADCIRCHSGSLLSDHQHYNLGVPPNPGIFGSPERHITFRRFFRTIGVGDYATLRHDPGCACVSKDDNHSGHFRTPSLREVSKTAPYMHNGMLKTLDDVVMFYNDGGGKTDGTNPRLQPLGLTADERANLVAFLETLSGDAIVCEPPDIPPYELQSLGGSK